MRLNATRCVPRLHSRAGTACDRASWWRDERERRRAHDLGRGDLTRRAVRRLAAERPDAPAVSCADDTRTWEALDRRTNRLARGLEARGVREGRFVTIGLPNGVAFVEACVACWKLGATPQPVSSRLPVAELDAIVALADPALVVRADPGEVAGRACVSAEALVDEADDDGPLPDHVSPAWKAPTSGGSTGRPKLIVSGPARPGELARDGLLAPRRHEHRADARAAVPQRSLRLRLHRPHGRRPPGGAPALRRAPHARAGGGAPGDLALPGAHDDEPHLAAPRRRQGEHRRVVAGDRVAPRRAVPALAQGGVDRVARRRAHLGALRRHRGAGDDGDHGNAVDGAAGLGGPAHQRRRAHPRRRGRRAAAAPGRRGLPPAPGRAPTRPTGTSAPSRAHAWRVGVARRPRLGRRGRLPLSRGSPSRHDPRRWLERVPGRGRGRARRAPASRPAQ